MSTIRKYTRNQFKSLILHLNAYEKSHDPEFLHRVRVDVKKIKSILQLLGSLKKIEVHKRFLPFRTIFRRAGELRDPGVHANILSRYHTHGKADKLDLADEKLIASFLYDIFLFKSRIQNERKKILPLTKTLEREKIRKYLKGKRQEIESGLSSKPSIKKIHKVRKKMKEVIYLSEGIGKGKKKLIDFYRKMEELIGGLHDRQILLEKLKKRNNNKFVQQEVLSESNDILNKIMVLSRQYYK